MTPRSPEDQLLAVRIGRAWRDLRRGASTAALRDYLLGTNEEAIELGQMDTLDLLATGKTWRMSEIAEALRVEPSTATRAIHRMVNAGLAVRLPSTDDGRVVCVQITDAGRATYNAVSRRRLALISHVMDRFENEEIISFTEMLERYVRLVDEFVEQQDGE